MPTETVAPPAPAPAAPAAPAAPQVPIQSSIDAAAGNEVMAFDSVMPKKEPPKESPAIKTPEPAKEAPKDAPKESPKAEEGEVDWTKAPPKWYKIYETHKAKTKGEIEELKTKLKALESKPQSAANDERITQYEKQIEELREKHTSSEKRLIESDYARSQEYQDKYVKRFNKERASAIEEIKGLQFVVKPAADGEPAQVRAATEADFADIAGMSPARQDAYLQEHFGSSAWRVVQRINELNRIRREAADAVAEHAESYHKSQSEKESLTKKQQEQFTAEKTKAQQALEEKFPSLFSAKHYESDPDAKKQLEEGYAFIDRSEKEIDEMPAEDKAAYGAVVRARAAAAPLLNMLLERAHKEVEDLKAELGKYRKSDPGSSRPGGGAPAPKEKAMGISDAAAAFDDAMAR